MFDQKTVIKNVLLFIVSFLLAYLVASWLTKERNEVSRIFHELYGRLGIQKVRRRMAEGMIIIDEAKLKPYRDHIESLDFSGF
jgi:hypothetical protein